MTIRSWIMVADKRTRFRRIMLANAAVCSVLAFVISYTHFGLMYYFNPTRTNRPDHVVILTASWCPYCRALKKALNASRLPYDEIDVERDWKTEYAFYATRQRGVPVTVIGSEIVERGLSAQLKALKQVCARTNAAGNYNCEILEPVTALRSGTAPDLQDSASGAASGSTVL